MLADRKTARRRQVHDWRYRTKIRFLRDTLGDPPFSSGPNYKGLILQAYWDHCAEYVRRKDAEWIHLYDRWIVAILRWRKKRREQQPPYLK